MSSEKVAKSSLPLVKNELKQRGSTIRSILIGTRIDNSAQKLYANTLGAEIVATIRNLFSADEVLMIAKDIEAIIPTEGDS